MSLAIAAVPDKLGQRARPVVHRLRQGIRALRNQPDPALDARLRSLVGNDELWALLARLTPFDRRHHLAVHDTLLAAGCDDTDVLRAALLHDVGKADSRQRVGLVHRVVTVLFQGRTSGLLNRIARQDAGWLRHGLWLNLHHAALGADLAALSGASARVCDLIRLHADGDAAAQDAGLRALQMADSEALL